MVSHEKDGCNAHLLFMVTIRAEKYANEKKKKKKMQRWSKDVDPSYAMASAQTEGRQGTQKTLFFVVLSLSLSLSLCVCFSYTFLV